MGRTLREPRIQGFRGFHGEIIRLWQRTCPSHCEKVRGRYRMEKNGPQLQQPDFGLEGSNSGVGSGMR